MISILGRAAILIALSACVIGLMTGLVAGLKRNQNAWKWSRWMAYVFAGASTAGIGLMEYALITHDFSVSYVAEVGSTKTPLWVTIVSPLGDFPVSKSCEDLHLSPYEQRPSFVKVPAQSLFLQLLRR